MINLRDALASNRLSDFIAQEEARGIGPIERAELDAGIAALVKGLQSEDRTSRSACDDGSTGKRTRPGSEPCTSR
jgi:hypothetical protein